VVRFIARRLVQAFVSLLGVTLVVFLLSRATGDPASLLIPIDATDAERAAFRTELGLDDPLPVQYAHFLGDLAHGDLGDSIKLGAPTSELIANRLPNSFVLAACAMGFSMVVGVSIGVLAARRPGGWADRVSSLIALFGQSIPTFWVGLMAVLLFAVTWRIFPPSDFDEPLSLVLPALTLGWFTTATMARIAQSSMREALDSQYVVVARSKGLSERVVVVRHALRNSIVSILTMGAVQFVLLLNGAVVTEKIFNWPGVGSLMVDAAFARDFPLVQALVLVAAALVIGVNFLMDVAYAYLDPRIRVQ